VDDLLTISAFARRVGLTPSALRFYDDCGVLRPALVDATTGYRYYSAEQEPRGRLLHDLRAVDLPLADVRTVLDGPSERSVEILRAHVQAVADKAEATRQAAARILDGLPPAELSCTVALAGPELASAIRQVTPSAGQDDLGGVLIELDADEVSLVATDRYRLAIRRLRPAAFAGTARPVVVPASDLAGLRSWIAAADEVRLSASDGVATVACGDEIRELTAADGFPDYRAILDGLPSEVTRVLVDRSGLADRLNGNGEPVIVEVERDRVVVDGIGLDAICSGAAVRIGFTPALLAAALADGVGPDVLLEIGPSSRPVVVRSADQGTFTTLVMPVRLDA
jgi:DNA polymerase III subunit beta